MGSKVEILVFFLALLLITGSAYAAVPGEDPSGDGPKIDRHQLLNLTPEQAAQVGIWGPKMFHRGHRDRGLVETN